MAESHVVSALVTKRSDLAGMIQFYRFETERVASDLKHLDATLKLFAPEINLRSLGTKRVRKSSMGGFKFLKPGESHRLILDLLREAGCSLLTADLLDQIIERKKLDDTQDVRMTLQRTISGSLRRLEQRGMVRHAGAGKGRALTWEIA